MPRKLRWGVLGVAAIAVKKVIPAMRKSELGEIYGLASRNQEKAERAARDLGIPRAYGSYDEMLGDPEIDAVYNPLPNHLHLEWTVKAAEAGKHVLCEKPIGLDAEEARQMLAVRDRTGVTIGEAFMVRTHPQWLRTRELAGSGAIGELRYIHGSFSYFNVNSDNIRNIPEYGGGALMDIGCYPVNTSRFVSGQEPTRVMALIERDPNMRTDRLTSAILDYPFGHATFTCSTQLAPYQRMLFFGTKGRIEIEIPFNAPPDRPTRIVWSDEAGEHVEEFPVCDQYTLQGDAFARAVAGEASPPNPLEDSVKNMEVIDALFESGATGAWIGIAQ